MAKLFKNAKVVDIKNEEVFDADIWVENGKIESFDKQYNFNGEVVDLQGCYVMPAFVNAFMDSVDAGKINYLKTDEKYVKNLQDLLLNKNLRAGAVFINDVSITEVPVLGNIDDKEEKELSSLSMEIAECGKRPFIKLGQDLIALGSVDKKYGKSAVAVLEDFGFLDRSPVVIGGNCLEKDDLQILGDYDCDFVVLPNEDGRVGRRQTNLISLMSKGLEVSVGSGNSAEIDFFSFMRQMLSSMRSMFEDSACISEKDVLKIATNGAVLGFENHLQVGANATFIVVDSRESLYDDIFKTLVWERSKSDVLMSVRNGEVLQKNGEIFMKNIPSYDTIIKNLKQ